VSGLPDANARNGGFFPAFSGSSGDGAGFDAGRLADTGFEPPETKETNSPGGGKAREMQTA
jgi:hypothetical protein